MHLLSFAFFFSVTGSCFFIFSSALKASAGYLAKSSIVEGKISTYRRDLNDFHILPAGRKFIIYVWKKKVKYPCLKTVLSGMWWSLYMCLSGRVNVLMHVSMGLFVCSSCIAVPPLLRWAYGAGHRGNHGGGSQVAPRDERLHSHMWAARPIKEPGARLFTVGGGEMCSEQGVGVYTCLNWTIQVKVQSNTVQRCTGITSRKWHILLKPRILLNNAYFPPTFIPVVFNCPSECAL